MTLKSPSRADERGINATTVGLNSFKNEGENLKILIEYANIFKNANVKKIM